MDGFEWDDANVEHIARHGVTPEEAEEALADLERIAYPANRGIERRRAIIGRTESGRLLLVVYTRREPRRLRVVTARDTTQRERHHFRGRTRR